MNDFNRCNKVTGVHWLKMPVENIRIKVKLKPQDGILLLPKFEDYASEPHSVSLQQLENIVEEYNFKWQEKVFNPWELQRYGDIHNCISDVELTYHDMIQQLDYEPSKICTYIHEDYHLPMPLQGLKKSNTLSVLEGLNSCLERLNITERVRRIFREDSSSMGRLFRSEDNISIEEEQWTAMHVVLDNSEYNEDSQLLLKQEATLLSLYHNRTHNYLIISPDVNNLELNPYTVETVSGTQWGYQYGIEIEFGEVQSGDELTVLLKKLYKKWEKKQKQVLNFEMLPPGKKLCYVTFEILTTTDFDIDNLYIEFDIKIPEGVLCTDGLRGRTHVTKALRAEGIDECHFGHIVELTLEMAVGTEPLPLHFIFEVISIDWWGRHRTEGYTCLPLALAPGRFAKQLSCSRPEELDSVEAESRRFFVGGCHLIKDLDVLIKPQLQDANFSYVTTGSLHVRWNAISRGAGARPAAAPGPSSAAALLHGAEAVLRQYRRARARLAHATRDFRGMGDA